MLDHTFSALHAGVINKLAEGRQLGKCFILPVDVCPSNEAIV